MRISALLEQGRTFSVELWPPRSEAAERRLERVLTELAPLRPSFSSITYGAGGSTRERTHELVVRLLHEGGPVPMAHLTCAAHTRAELSTILTRYRDAGIDNILALHGDPPLDSTSDLPEGDLGHAVELVELARGIADFCVAVALHPEGHPRSPDRASDRRHQANKLARADFGITQFFFHVEDYLSLVEDLSALGVDKPIVPGIMPITSLRTVSRMAEMSGTAVPRAVVERVEAVADDPEAIRKVGVDIAAELAQKLIAEGVPGVHVYTMNQPGATLELASRLGLGDR